MDVPTLHLKSGDHRIVRITVYADDGVTPQNLTGVTVKFQIALRLQNQPLVLKSTDPGGGITVVDPVGGVIEIELLPIDTDDLSGRYIYEMELTDPSGRKSTVYFVNEKRYYSTVMIEHDLIVEAA